MKEDVSKAELFELLQRRYRSSPSEIDQIDQRIKSRYSSSLAVMVVDLSGFTRLTKKYGIIHFLCLYKKASDIAAVLVEKQGGALLKTEADNFLASFPTPHQAVQAAIDLHRQYEKENSVRGEEERIYACTGISCGEVLKTDYDVYGDAVNVAHKLGEDIAKPDDILVSQDIQTQVSADPSNSIRFQQKMEATTGGIVIPYYRVIRD